MDAHKTAHEHNVNKGGNKMSVISGEQLLSCIAGVIKEYGFYWDDTNLSETSKNDSEILVKAMQGYAQGNLYFSNKEKDNISIEEIFDITAQKLQN